MLHVIRAAYPRMIAWLESWLSGRYWAWKATLGTLIIMALLSSFPQLENVFVSGEISRNFTAIQLKAHDIGYDLLNEYDPNSGSAKQQFRLVMPVITAAFGLSQHGMYLVQLLFGVGLIYVVIQLGTQITNDRVIAFLIAVAVACMWSGSSGFVELRGTFDVIPYFFLLLAMWIKSPPIIFVAIFCAGWGDERGLIASSLVFVYYWVSQSPPGERFRPAHLLKPQLIAIVLAWVAYFVTRQIYMTTYDLRTVGESTGFERLRLNLNILPFGMWTALEGTWIPVVLAFGMLIRQRRFLLFAAFIVALMAVLIVAHMVVDVTRSAAYALPAVFVALALLKDSEERHNLRLIATITVAVALFWPAYTADDWATVYWISPLPVHLPRWLLNGLEGKIMFTPTGS